MSQYQLLLRASVVIGRPHKKLEKPVGKRLFEDRTPGVAIGLASQVWRVETLRMRLQHFLQYPLTTVPFFLVYPFTQHIPVVEGVVGEITGAGGGVTGVDTGVGVELGVATGMFQRVERTAQTSLTSQALPL